MKRPANRKSTQLNVSTRPLSPDAQLCDRHQAAQLLGVSFSTIRNLERHGKLTGRTLTDSPSSRKMFEVADVLALARVSKACRLLPDLGSVIVVNGRTYREVIDEAAT
ncbi:hypothetical protein [Bradyrhizobium sp. ERR14]|uniref:hypothetical protein n=1 Tax=Bradyrhizobium sp. ERR14 TaxID=2663837 RepID=UPI001618CDF4|nr:hypothetical protein [Bradyrhizobium sp. ERR14]MBB4391754.1 hypothetical protein [Bradyrhizobium sp. ERR14]